MTQPPFGYSSEFDVADLGSLTEAGVTNAQVTTGSTLTFQVTLADVDVVKGNYLATLPLPASPAPSSSTALMPVEQEGTTSTANSTVAAGENLNQLRFLQEEAQNINGDLRASSYMDLVLKHTRLLRELDEAYRKMSQKRLE